MKCIFLQVMTAMLPCDTMLCSIQKSNCCTFYTNNLWHFFTKFWPFFVQSSPPKYICTTLKYVLMKCTFLQVMTAMLPCDTMLCSIRKTMDLGSFNLNKWTRLSQPTQWETCHLSPFTNSVFKLLMTLDPLVGQLTRIWPRPCPVHLQVCTYLPIRVHSIF